MKAEFLRLLSWGTDDDFDIVCRHQILGHSPNLGLKIVTLNIAKYFELFFAWWLSSDAQQSPSTQGIVTARQKQHVYFFKYQPFRRGSMGPNLTVRSSFQLSSRLGADTIL